MKREFQIVQSKTGTKGGYFLKFVKEAPFLKTKGDRNNYHVTELNIISHYEEKILRVVSFVSILILISLTESGLYEGEGLEHG